MQISRRGVRTVLRMCRLCYRDPQSLFLMLRMAWWVAALSLLVKVMALPRVLKLMSPRPHKIRISQDQTMEARLAKALDSVLGTDWLVFTPTCWKRAAVLHRYLALNGIETRIVFGVNKESGGELEGHAWLEAEGRPILEKTFPHFTVTYSFPA